MVTVPCSSCCRVVPDDEVLFILQQTGYSVARVRTHSSISNLISSTDCDCYASKVLEMVIICACARICAFLLYITLTVCCAEHHADQDHSIVKSREWNILQLTTTLPPYRPPSLLPSPPPSFPPSLTPSLPRLLYPSNPSSLISPIASLSFFSI